MTDGPTAPHAGRHCPACGFDGPSLDPSSCGRCGVVFARYHAPGQVLSQGPSSGEPPSPTSTGVLVADPPALENLWALPTAFGLAALLNLTGLGKVLVFASASNWAHELGHATWRWVNGRDAISVLFFTLYFSTERTVLTSLVILGGLAALFIWSRQEECAALQGLAVVLLVLFLAFAIAMPPATEHFLESFAGVFGEFWIATLWVMLFYYRFPAVLRWENLRFAFLFLGALSLTRITWVFLASRHDMSLLPWGSFFGGDGDLDHLLEGGWLVPKIRRVYFTIGAICWATVGGHYVFFARKALART